VPTTPTSAPKRKAILLFRITLRKSFIEPAA